MNGAIYVLSGLSTRHFRERLLPARADLGWSAIATVVANHVRLTPAAGGSQTYNVLQRLTYLAVVFALFPLMIWTGLAMSPALTSVFPLLVTILGGQQSARTIHFFVASAIVLFLLLHVAMVCLAGFSHRIRGMTIGGRPVSPEDI